VQLHNITHIKKKISLEVFRHKLIFQSCLRSNQFAPTCEAPLGVLKQPEKSLFFLQSVNCSFSPKLIIRHRIAIGVRDFVTLPSDGIISLSVRKYLLIIGLCLVVGLFAGFGWASFAKILTPVTPKKGVSPVARPLRLTCTDVLLPLFVDFSALAVAYCFAYFLRFEGAIPVEEFQAMALSLPLVLVVQLLCMVGCNVPGLSWRYVSLLEASRISMALTAAAVLVLLWIASAGFVGIWVPAIHSAIPPRGVIIMGLVLGVMSMIGMRVAVRLWYERLERSRCGIAKTVKIPTLLIGAGSAGAEAVKQIAAAPQLGIELVGFLDDDQKKHGKVIHGTRVLGSVADVARIARVHGAKQALITIGSPSDVHLRRIVNCCKECGVTTKVIPDIAHILEGNVNLAQIRDLAIEDLLPRKPVQLDLEAIAGFVNGRGILITGAGGSIGSELCRTVSRFGPDRLILVENTENNLFHIHRELVEGPYCRHVSRSSGPGEGGAGVQVIPVLADICDQVRMKRIFATYRPDMVLHAAAYKHVPMVEWNAGGAIKNNVVGTRTIADLADQYDVSEFVMISTDKAVNPTSIMGASKRIAEIYIQALSQQSRTRFVAVRFGNVLGSAGSVIPTFKEQIARGGPVTVTHPDMKRYFMTIPEASQLVLQAATLGRGGEIFILDMGEPVKIVDLARNLILLSGLSLDDIEIRFTGVRPGEKLYEELALDEEVAEKTRHPKIFIGRLQPADWDDISQAVESLRHLAENPKTSEILRKIKEIVPEFEGGESDTPSSVTFPSAPGVHVEAST
jgi:FlaA1/EpsC-like NDP-sugar epimerase